MIIMEFLYEYWNYVTYDRVWHGGLFYKLKSNGIDSNLFKLIKSFLNRCQRVVLNGESSVWKSIKDSVAKVSSRPIIFSHLH